LRSWPKTIISLILENISNWQLGKLYKTIRISAVNNRITHFEV
jgi:hypothetical protein